MKLVAPAAERNCEPICAVLKPYLPSPCKILEIASGTGQHAAYMTAHLPELTWQPSDHDPACLASIAAYRAEADPKRFLSPLRLSTLEEETWGGLASFDALVCCNMIHIAPWAATLGLFKLASSHVLMHGLLILYGPFIRNAVATTPSNLAFDRSLRQRDPAWGLRHLDNELLPLAAAHGFALEKVHEMPANNLMLILRIGARPDGSFA